MKSICLTLLCLLLPVLAFAQEPEAEEAPAPLSLPELVHAADLVALVRVLDTDYEYAREFPVGGTAFLQVLVPYKVGRPLEDIVPVYEEGLHEGECYFDNPSVAEEGRRHLVFLRFNPEVEGQYLGLPQGCALEVLVNERNLYALRYPPAGITLADDLSEHATPMTFRDAHALMEDEEITPTVRNELLEAGYLVRIDQNYRYTHGIDISVVRHLMGPEALTLDRSLK
jgi:hypothetical protein